MAEMFYLCQPSVVVGKFSFHSYGFEDMFGSLAMTKNQEATRRDGVVEQLLVFIPPLLLLHPGD